jgi:hypothetical protein
VSLKPTGKGSGNVSAPAASREASKRRTSSDLLEDVSGLLNDAPVYTISTAQVEKEVSPPGKRSNKTLVYVTGVRNTRRLPEWIHAKSGSRIVAQMKGEYLMLVPETADGFRVTIGALKSLGEGEGMSFHTFSLPEDRCVRLLLKNLGKRMPDHEIMEEMEAMGIQVQAIMHSDRGGGDLDAEKDRPLTPHFIVSVARVADVAKLRSLTELCGLRIKVETYNAAKGPPQCKRCQRFGHTQHNCGYAARCVICGDAHPSGTCVTPKQQLQLWRQPHCKISRMK